MKYPGVEINERYAALLCPTCENERILDGDYCQICGTMIVNKCTNSRCGSLLSGDARFCQKCGQTSTFFELGFLRDWKSIKRKADNTKIFLGLDDNETNFDSEMRYRKYSRSFFYPR